MNIDAKTGLPIPVEAAVGPHDMNRRARRRIGYRGAAGDHVGAPLASRFVRRHIDRARAAMAADHGPLTRRERRTVGRIVRELRHE